MPLLKIARLGQPQIRKPAECVSKEDLQSPKFQRFIDDMVKTMQDANGVGLAAPQVHASSQIMVIEVSPDNPRYPNQALVPLTIMINPKIIEHSEEIENGWEGCLSVPDLRGLVPRWRSVKVVGLDRQGDGIEIEATGFFARVIQHEVDHLNGAVFLDRLPDLRTLTHLKEYEKYWVRGGTS